MCADVAENGFTTAALLHYNHRTGAAYLAEGNHRVGIATELGIPVPLVVYRTTKTAPDYPMRALTEPGEFSMRDAEGFSRFPQEASPALIGLPLLNPRARIDIEAVERMAAAREEDRTPALAPERAAESGFEM
jgi:hypothetical protein